MKYKVTLNNYIGRLSCGGQDSGEEKRPPSET